jgi:hypothetical protein
MVRSFRFWFDALPELLRAQTPIYARIGTKTTPDAIT